MLYNHSTPDKEQFNKSLKAKITMKFEMTMMMDVRTFDHNGT